MTEKNAEVSASIKPVYFLDDRITMMYLEIHNPAVVLCYSAPMTGFLDSYKLN